MIYIVSPGDSVFSVASAFSVSPARLRYDNQLNPTDTLVIGQALLILIPQTVHQVMQGDTAISIAESYGITLRELLQRNPFLAQNISANVSSDEDIPTLFSSQIPLTPGQFLVIRYIEESTDTTSLEGYAYPFIRKNTLRETLPYLSTLYVFSYGFNTDGSLIAPPNADFLLQEATLFGVKPILVLTPLTESGTFNSNLIVALLEDELLQEQIISELTRVSLEKGFGGIDVDFEFIPEENRDDYTTFVARLATAAHQNDLTVSVALPPKTSADQRGLLYEGIDYGGLGAVADQVLLMTYEWGYTYGPPLAIAPLPNVRRVVEYALTEIPSDKIFLGIPNYAYDWPLPYIRGTTAATTIGNAQAVDIARANGAVVQYDEQAQAPFFTYNAGGTEREVWFEDARSIQAKFDLIKEYGLAGGGYWNLMRPFRANWVMAGTEFLLE